MSYHLKRLVEILLAIGTIVVPIMLVGDKVHAQARDECITARMAGATTADAPGLISDVACLAKLQKNVGAQMVVRLELIARLLASAPPIAAPPAPVVSAKFPIAPIVSNFTRSDYIGPSGIPASAKPDVVGAFRFLCQPSHLAYDDPIVYPGQKGKSHLHQFYGNTGANADSTYTSLRTTGDSTCMNILNRSAYWIPAMLLDVDGKTKVLRPDYVSVYYKRMPKDDPNCQRQGNECVAQPDGIKYILGYDMLTGGSKGGFNYQCKGTEDYVTYANLEEVSEDCENPTEIIARVIGRDCWDGKNLDSSNHQSHVVSPSYGSWGYLKCPATHPKILPRFDFNTHYTVSGITKEQIATLRLSSDAHAGTKRGASLHADLWDAWDDKTKATWTTNCIDKLLNCSDGVLGDGTIMKRWAGFGYKAEPRLVPMAVQVPAGGM